jgi:hypothetical protein
MRKRPTVILMMLLLATNLSAGDPWKDKSYKQWDERDLRRVMTESPWVKTVQVESTWGASTSGNEPSALGASGSAASNDPQDILRGAKPMTGAAPQVVFLVRWASSRTIRRGLARGAVLRGTPEAEAEKFLAQEPAEYGVVVLGPDMTPFTKADENDWKELKEKSFLAPKKLKAKLGPSRIFVERSGDGKKVLAVYFYFPKKTATGEPALPAEERSAEFVCQLGRLTLKASFDLQKMTDSQGIDL